MSRKLQRKLAQLEREKAKKAKRAELYKSLEASQLTPEQQRLMVSSRNLSRKTTVKERVKHAFFRVRAGVQVDEDDKQLLVGDRKVDEERAEQAKAELAAAAAAAASASSSAAVSLPLGDMSKLWAGKSHNEEADDDDGDDAMPDATASPTVDSDEEVEDVEAFLQQLEEEYPVEPQDTSVSAGQLAPQFQVRLPRLRHAQLATEPPRKLKRKKRSGPPGLDSDGDDSGAPTPAAPLPRMEFKLPSHILERNKQLLSSAAETTAPASSSSSSSTTATIKPVSREPQQEALSNLGPSNVPLRKRLKLTELATARSVMLMPDSDALQVRVSNNPFVYRADAPEAQQALLVAPSTEPVAKLPRKRFVVKVDRKPEMQAGRMKLPICAQEREVVEMIQDNLVTIICGATGSGKTTQVPQFLYEHGYSFEQGVPGMIGVTEPRRVAAISTAKRVAEELNIGFGSQVAYQVRYESRVTADTQIKFMTDGILLREIQGDFLLRKYSVIILDEAHERNVNTDMLIGLLSRIVPLRYRLSQESGGTDKIHPLRVIIMSATLRVDDFVKNEKLFPVPPPVLEVGSRQHPVTVHFNRRTELVHYEQEVIRKVGKIHDRLPPGGILVFMTGRREIEMVCSQLRERYSAARLAARSARLAEGDGSGSDESSDSDSDESSSSSDEEEEEEEEEAEPTASDTPTGPGPVRVLPLYSALPPKRQLEVFQPVPEGTRLIVVATNVAETSLTIPGIKYVVDPGREKQRQYDKVTGTFEFVVGWISKASARQRAGRAGRTGPGHVYRLYSSAVFNDRFAEFSDPEILRNPIESTLLQMKSMNIHRVDAFPFPTPPDELGLRMAEKTLVLLGAIDKTTGRATDLGRTLAKFPVAPRYAKMLVLGHQQDCLPFVISLVASLSVETLFLDTRHDIEGNDEDGGDEDEDEEMAFKSAKQKKSEASRKYRVVQKKAVEAQERWVHNRSDLLTRLRLIGGFVYAGGDASREAAAEFAKANFVRLKPLLEVAKQRKQLSRIMLSVVGDEDVEDEDADEETPGRERVDGAVGLSAHVRKVLKGEARMKPPTPTQEILVRQAVAAGLLDRVARRLPNGRSFTLNGETVVSGESPQLTGAYECLTTSEPVFIHPTSAMFKAGSRPEFLVYHELIRTTKCYLRGVTAIEPSWLPAIAGALCTESQPLDDPAPIYNSSKDEVQCFVSGHFGPNNWKLPLRRRPFADSETVAFAHFARLLLQGAIIPAFLDWRPFLVARPQALISQRSSSRSTKLWRTLQRAGIRSKQALLARWRREPKFLLQPVEQWIQPAKRKDVRAVWPPVL